MSTNGASNGTNNTGGTVLCSLEEFVSRKYDYIVVGGGTAGLVVAARLTENPDVTVGVIEAGANRMDDKAVSTPSLYPTLIGREKYDWCMQSTPQPTAANKTYSMPRGKLLGGSSAINYLMYVRGSRADYDSWENLGNKGWGWNDLVPYFKKHQTLDTNKLSPTDKPAFMPHGQVEKYHGRDGPIHTSFVDWYMPLEEDFVQACYDIGGRSPTIVDAWSGDHMGFYSSLAAVDRSGDPGTRSYAASGYLRPNLGRKNLRVLTETLATRVLLEDGKAVGVELRYGGQTHKVSATREVVLSAGVIQSPQLLELSGIGDPEVLRKAGVQCLVENKAVGANFQDHVLGGMLYDLKPGVRSMDALGQSEEFANQQQEVYDKTGAGLFGSPGMLMGFVSYASLVSKDELEQTIKEIREHSRSETPFEKAQEEEIVRQLSDPSFANIQVFFIPCSLDLSAGTDQTKFFAAPPSGKNRASLLVCLEHPLSRGTVHISNADAAVQPQIDPGYLRHPVDAKLLAAGIRWMDQVARHELMAKSLGDRVLPPQGQSIETEAERVEYVKNHISTQYHLIGSCALGEVVDERLKVKGVKGLRVVDASNFPSHVSGNIMSSTYAVAEKGADLIKADDGRF